MMPVILLTVLILVLFWKLSSFPITANATGAGTMTVHSTTFRPEQPVPVAAAAEALLPAARVEASAATPVAAKKFNLRRALMTGVAIAALAGAAWYGWN